MFIKKIIGIKGIGKYYDYSFKKSKDNDWNGELSRNTIIYADNASGKTTLAQIIKSLSKSSEIMDLRRRKSFGFKEVPNIKISLQDAGVDIYDEYNGNDWTRRLNHIIVFDTYYVERNIYFISPSKKMGNTDATTAILGEKCIEMYEKYTMLKNALMKFKTEKPRIERELSLHHVAIGTPETEQRLYQELCEKLEICKKKIDETNKKILELQHKMNQETDSIERYVKEINRYLSSFAPDIQLSTPQLKAKSHLISYRINIKGYEMRSKRNSTGKILSDGEKHALAFSFFLATLDVVKDKKKYVVVFDDPMSSLDTFRKQSTICQLSRLSNQVSQLILLSHDKFFLRDYLKIHKRLFNDDQPVVLKIQYYDKKGSSIKWYDIIEDTKSGWAKDLQIVTDYVNGEKDKCDETEVARSIRPIIEGYLRLKYSALSVFNGATTLGRMINIMKKNDKGKFNSIQKYIEDLEDINIYASDFHHENPSEGVVASSSIELLNYCKRTLNLLMII